MSAFRQVNATRNDAADSLFLAGDSKPGCWNPLRGLRLSSLSCSMSEAYAIVQKS